MDPRLGRSPSPAMSIGRDGKPLAHHKHSRPDSRSNSRASSRPSSRGSPFASTNPVLLSALHQGGTSQLPPFAGLALPSVPLHRVSPLPLPGFSHPMFQGHGLVGLPPASSVSPDLLSVRTAVSNSSLSPGSQSSVSPLTAFRQSPLSQQFPADLLRLPGANCSESLNLAQLSLPHNPRSEFIAEHYRRLNEASARAEGGYKPDISPYCAPGSKGESLCMPPPPFRDHHRMEFIDQSSGFKEPFQVAGMRENVDNEREYTTVSKYGAEFDTRTSYPSSGTLAYLIKMSSNHPSTLPGVNPSQMDASMLQSNRGFVRGKDYHEDKLQPHLTQEQTRSSKDSVTFCHPKGVVTSFYSELPRQQVSQNPPVISSSAHSSYASQHPMCTARSLDTFSAANMVCGNAAVSRNPHLSVYSDTKYSEGMLNTQQNFSSVPNTNIYFSRQNIPMTIASHSGSVPNVLPTAPSHATVNVCQRGPKPIIAQKPTVQTSQPSVDIVRVPSTHSQIKDISTHFRTSTQIPSAFTFTDVGNYRSESVTSENESTLPSSQHETNHKTQSSVGCEGKNLAAKDTEEIQSGNLGSQSATSKAALDSGRPTAFVPVNGVAASAGNTTICWELERPSPLNKRPETLNNFPSTQGNARVTYRVHTMAIHRAKAGSITNAAKSLDLLRQNLQKSFNEEIDEIVQCYVETFFRPAMSNINENMGEESPGMEEHLHTLCSQLLEEAKRQYGGGDNSSVTTEVNDNLSETGSRCSRAPLVENKDIRAVKHSLFNIRKRRGSSDSDVSTSRKRVRKPKNWGTSSGRSTPVKKHSGGGGAEAVRKEGPQWHPERLTTLLQFVMGSKANKALGLGSQRGRLYTKHPSLFKYIGDSEDKQWLQSQKRMPVTGGRAYLLVVDDILELAETPEYKDSGCLLLDELHGFTVPQFMVDKMRRQMAQQRSSKPRSSGPSRSNMNSEDEGEEVEIPFSVYSPAPNSDPPAPNSDSPAPNSEPPQPSPATTDLSFDDEDSQMSRLHRTGGFSPAPCALSPAQRTNSPSQRSVSPAHFTVSSTYRTSSRSDRSVSPTHFTFSSAHRTSSPSHRSVSPNPRTSSPFHGNSNPCHLGNSHAPQTYISSAPVLRATLPAVETVDVESAIQNSNTGSAVQKSHLKTLASFT